MKNSRISQICVPKNETKMKVALIQTHLIWENPLENRSHLAQKITGFMEDVDLIVLPEMFSTGYTMHPKCRGNHARRNRGLVATFGKSQKLCNYG